MKFSTHFFDYPSAYESFKDIPDGKKLRSFETEFDGENIIDGYISLYFYNKGYNKKTIQNVEQSMSDWKETCRERGCHPVLASPETVDIWCQKLLQRLKPLSIKYNYLTYVNRLYRYLMWHVDYPHCYNPVQFAVREYPAAKNVWDEKGEN